MTEISAPSRSVSTWGVAVGLVSLHYGMGFILGTGEQTYLYGASGAVYALAAGLGLLGLAALASFYWRMQEPIWNLLGSRYGEAVRHLTNFLSWVWMVGVMAGQMVGAGYALSILGIPHQIAIVLMAMAIAILGSIPLERVAWLFASLLVISTLALLLTLIRLGGLSLYWKTVEEFSPALLSTSLLRVLGIAITTFLLTLIGMDFQQVLVTARTNLAAARGSLLAGLALIPIAFLPTAVVLGAMQRRIVTVGTINGKDAIPLILSNLGNQIFHDGGLVLVISLVLVAIGSGSGLNRALIRSFQAAPFMPDAFKRSAVASWINAVLALGIALTGLTIVGLMVSSYAIYVAGVFVPFMIYLLELRRGIRLPSHAVRLSAWAGSGIAALIFITGLIGRLTHSTIFAWAEETPEIWMTLVGMLISALTLWGTVSIHGIRRKPKRPHT